MVLRYECNGSLDKFIKQDEFNWFKDGLNAQKLSNSVKAICDAAAGIAHIHKSGIVHLDQRCQTERDPSGTGWDHVVRFVFFFEPTRPNQPAC